MTYTVTLTHNEHGAVVQTEPSAHMWRTLEDAATLLGVRLNPRSGERGVLVNSDPILLDGEEGEPYPLQLVYGLNGLLDVKETGSWRIRRVAALSATIDRLRAERAA